MDINTKRKTNYKKSNSNRKKLLNNKSNSALKIDSREIFPEERKGTTSKKFEGNKKNCEDHFSKLYEEKFIRDKKLEESQLVKEREEIKKYTFKPRLLKTSKSQSYLKGVKNNFFETMNYVKSKMNLRNLTRRRTKLKL